MFIQYSAMPSKKLDDRLYKADFRSIWAHYPTPEVRALLWEIRRMQDLLIECADLLRYLDRDPPHTHATYRNAAGPLRTLLEAEPAYRWRDMAQQQFRRQNRGAVGTNPVDDEPDIKERPD